jgi:hypothetical protein
MLAIGKVQKGPFIDLQVEVIPINENGQYGDARFAQTNGSAYEFETQAGQVVNVRAWGTYIDELTGAEREVSQDVPLQVIYTAGEEPQNINVLTTMATSLSQSLTSSPPLDAYTDAQLSIAQGLGLDAQQSFASMDIEQIESQNDPDFTLLTIGGAILQQSPANQEAPLSGLPFEFSNMLELLAQGTSVDTVLNTFNGIDVAGIYAAIQQANIIETLPDLPSLGGTIYLCEPLCQFIPDLGPTVTINNAFVYEGQGKSQVKITRTGDSVSALSVNVSFTEAAAMSDKDFAATPTQIDFATGQTVAFADFYPITDTVTENDETFTVEISLVDTSVYSLRRSQAIVTIKDGIPASARLPAEADISTSGCFVDVGIASTLLANSELPTCAAGDAEENASGEAIDASGQASLQFLSSVEADCNSVACNASIYWPFVARLEAIDTQTNSVAAFEELGEILYPTSSISAQQSSPEQERFASIPAELVSDFIGTAVSNQHTLRISLVARDSALATVTPEPIRLPQLAPASEIVFGQEQFTLAAGALLTSDATCPNASDTSIDGRFETSVTLGGQAFDYAYEGSVCASYVIDETGAGGWEVSASDIDISDTGTFLADGLFTFFQAERSNSASIRSSRRLPFAVAQFVLPSPLDVTMQAYLGAEELPFGLRIIDIRLTEQGIRLNYDDSELLDAAGFYPGDPRAQGASTNTAIYANVAPGSLTLTQDGFDGQVTFLAGSAETVWPKGSLNWQSFTVAIEDGQLIDHSIDVDFAMQQSLDCTSISCSQGNQELHKVSGILNVDAQGTGIGSVQVANTSVLAWGALTSGNAWELKAALEANAQATLVLPGFTQRYLPNASENVADALLAHRRPSAILHGAFAPGSDEFSLGNFFAPGLTVGPELYVNGSGQPQVDSGSSLAGLDFALQQASNSEQTVRSHEATKFVIQNSGLTGVINADPSTMPQAYAASGFDISLDRFALRTQNNRNDSYNWIDGGLRIEGDAKIGFAFNNLDMSCDGSLSDAQMVAESCGQGPCLLDSWRAEIDVFAFGFADVNGEPLACSGQAPALSLEHDIEFKALDKPLAMQSYWNPQGELQRSELNAQSQYRLDNRSDKAGYPLLLTDAELLAPFDLSEPEAIRYGTLEVQGNIGVPFWLPLDADIRLANTLSFGSTVAEASVVVPQQTFDNSAFAAIESALNIDVQAQILEDAQFDFDARYEWGNTGFGFQLPVYYDLALNSQEVSFLGRKQEIDLFVLNAGAGIDFIQPDRTKLSFGASADFAALKKVRFQVDLTDTEGLAKVDQLLIQANIIQTPVISPTFENITNVVGIVNDITGAGLDPLMERLLLQAVTRGGEAAIPAMPNGKDPFDTLADTMAEIKNFPNHLIAQTDELVFNPIDNLLSQQELALRAQLIEVVEEVEAIAPGEQIQAPLQLRISQAKTALSAAQQDIRGAFEPAERALADVSLQVKQIEQSVEQARVAKDEIEIIFAEITSVVASQCAIDGSVIGSESAGYLEGAFQQLNDIKQLVQLLSSSEALVTLADLIVEDPEVKATIAQTQDTLREGADVLLEKITTAEVEVRTKLCQSDVTTLLAQINQLLQQVDQHISQMEQLVMQVDGSILIVQNQVKFAKAQVLTPLSQLNAVIGEIENELEKRLADASGEVVITRLNTLIARHSANTITVIVARNAGDIDVFDFAFQQLKAELDGVRTALVSNLQQQAEGLFPFGDMSADQLRRQLVTLVMASEPVQAIREELNKNVVEIIRKANEQMLVMTDQANQVVQEAMSRVETEANKVLEEATAAVRDIPLDSGKLDGFAVIAGNELERAHIGAQWTMSSSDESEPGNTFGAALDAVSWAANGKAEGCAGPGAESNLDVTISAMGIPAKIGPSDITIKKVYLGFTLASAENAAGFKPIGVNGGISTSGDIGFSEFLIYDPAFAAGIGLQEVYLGAAAGAVFSDIQAEVAFLVGKTCNQDILMELDPNVAQYIPIPDTGFTGAYIRGAASIPVYTNGCPLTIGVAADVGAWILKGPPLTVGGLVGGGAFGTVGCVGALRGQIRALGQVNTDGDITFVGEGFGVAGLGLCEPASWTTVERSRQDGLCGTADARFTAGYINGWSVLNLSVSAIH